MANQVIATDGLLFRVAPGKDGPLIRGIPKGEVFTLRSGSAIVDGYSWYRLTDAHNVGGWAAVNWLTPVMVPPVAPPTTKRTVSVFSMHVLTGANTSLVLDVVDSCARAGKALLGIILTASNLTPQDIWHLSPTTEVIWRPYDGNDAQVDWAQPDLHQVGRDTVDWWFNKYFPNQSFLVHDKLYYQILNEQAAVNNTFWQGALDRANELHVKLCLPNFTLGYPKLPSDPPPDNGYWTDPTTWAVLRRVRDEGHRFMMHMGVAPGSTGAAAWSDKYTFLRHQLIYPYLPADLQTLPWCAGEDGEEQTTAHYTADQWIALLRQADAAMVNDTVLYRCLWTVGPGFGWEKDDLSAFVPALKQYLLMY